MFEKTVFLSDKLTRALSSLVRNLSLRNPSLRNPTGVVGIPLAVAEEAYDRLYDACSTMMATNWSSVEMHYAGGLEAGISSLYNAYTEMLIELWAAIDVAKNPLLAKGAGDAPEVYGTVLATLSHLNKPLPDDMGAALGRSVETMWEREGPKGGVRILVECPPGQIGRTSDGGKPVRTYVYAYPKAWLTEALRALTA